MSVRKRMALLRKYVEEAGLVLDAFVSGVSNRVTCIARAEDNEVMRFALSVKEGDMHADMNERSRIRRFAQAHQEKPDEIPGTPSTVDAARVMDALDKLPRAVEPTAAPFHPSPPIDWAPETQAPVATQEPLMAGHLDEQHMTEINAAARTLAALPAAPKKLIPTRLSAVNIMKFAAWLDSEDTGKYLTYDAVGVAAGVALGVRPTTLVVKELMLDKGKKLLHRPMINATSMQVVARNLVRLMEKLGEPPDDALLAMLKE